MAEIRQINGRAVVDYMARDYDSFLQAMRDLIPLKVNEWRDYESEADFGNVLLQLFAHMGDILSYYQDRVANESFLGAARTRRAVIHHLRLIGYTLATAAPASAGLTLSAPPGKTDSVTIEKGDAFATKSRKDAPSIRFEYTRDHPLAIDWGAVVEIDPGTGRKLVKGVPVEEGRLIEEEVLGESDGTADQRFVLGHSGLIRRSLGLGESIQKDIVLITDLSGVVDEWTPRDSLAFSREEQKDFVIEIDEEDRAEILFGDGAFGAIPPNNAEIKATYRVGGGARGNAPAGAIGTIVGATSLALMGATVTNPGPATGGADRESIAHAVRHAPSVFRSLKRAVTAEDYEALALDFKGVGKVRAVPASWNTVSLFVAPEGGGAVSDVLRANLLAYFEDKRAISTIIEIEDVEYVAIYVTAEIGVESHYPEEEVIENVKGAAGSLLAFENVDFKKTIYLSKFYEKIEAVNGVAWVNIKEFRSVVEGDAAVVEGDDAVENADDIVEDNGKIVLTDNQIPVAPDPTNAPGYAGGVKVTLERES